MKDGEYNDRDALHKYGVFASLKYIPALINQNPADHQAFSITDNMITRSLDIMDSFGYPQLLLAAQQTIAYAGIALIDCVFYTCIMIIFVLQYL